jgi:prepilin-type N-terminal cleavage/methylation domain-containing protein
MTRRGSGRAYSLLEVIITLVVASVVAGIAVAGYKTLTSAAVSMSTSAALDRAVVLERTHSLTNGSYTADTDALNAKSSDLVWVSGAATGLEGKRTVVSVAVRDGSVGLAAQDEDGNCQARVLTPVSDEGVERSVEVSACTGAAALG